MSFSILLVDDSRITRSIIIKALKMAQIPIKEIYEAANGREGLEQIKNHEIDLVFADINMPIMNGIEMIEKIYQNEQLAYLKIIIISTEGSLERIKQLKAKGVEGYIQKPFTPEQIKETINEVMKNGITN